MANPASPRLKPWRVKYNVRNGTTNVPNLLRKTPANKIQTGRGNDRSVVPRDSLTGPGVVGSVCISNKKPCRPFGGQGGEIVDSTRLAWSLLPEGNALRGNAPIRARHLAGDDDGDAARVRALPRIKVRHRSHACARE